MSRFILARYLVSLGYALRLTAGPRWHQQRRVRPHNSASRSRTLPYGSSMRRATATVISARAVAGIVEQSFERLSGIGISADLIVVPRSALPGPQPTSLPLLLRGPRRACDLFVWLERLGKVAGCVVRITKPAK